MAWREWRNKEARRPSFEQIVSRVHAPQRKRRRHGAVSHAHDVGQALGSRRWVGDSSTWLSETCI